jgi:hypothetical protein
MPALDGLLGTNDHGVDMAGPSLVGREREFGVLDDLVDRVGERGRVLVVRNAVPDTWHATRPSRRPGPRRSSS